MAVLLLIWLIRWSWGRSPLIGLLTLLGVLARIVAGAALVWISVRHLPILPNLQIGNGFWVLALDGVSYYNAAQTAVERGLSTISSASASPAYVRLLTLALHAWGESPLAAVLLNVIAYTLSCAVCLLMWPRHVNGGLRHARTIAIVALSFTPSLLLASTQPLKDQVFAFAIVAALACIQAGATAITTNGSGALVSGTFAFAGAAAAVYLISGIRAYYGVMIVLAMGSALTITTIALPLRRWARHIAVTFAATALLWVAFIRGAGPYAAPYEQFLSTTLSIPSGRQSASSPTTSFDTAREGFVTTGGATNIVRRHTPGQQPISERMMDEATGLMALFIPITILRGLSIVNFNGGRGLLAITDIDTIFLDLTIAIQLSLLLRYKWGRQRDVVFLGFTIVLAAAVMIPMAYVVTNYGTMFRLRLMYAAPLWLSSASLATIPLRVHSGDVDSSSS